jgi:hypothetical protein
MNYSRFATGLCIPSRGVIHSRTIEACLRELKGMDWEPCFEHEKPIPDAQNAVVMQALDAHCDLIWMVEEDIVPAPGVLLAMMSRTIEARVVSARYKIRENLWCDVQHKNHLVFSGLGCLLIESSVFSQLTFPFFRSDIEYTQEGDKLRRVRNLSEHEKLSTYGKQDIHFFYTLQEAGIHAVIHPVECEHLRIAAYGQPMTNNGFHKVVAIT